MTTTDTSNPKSWGLLTGQDINVILNAPHGAWQSIIKSRKKPIKYTVNRSQTLTLAKSDKVYVSAYTSDEAERLAKPMFVDPLPDFTLGEILDAKAKIKDVFTVWKT